MLHAVARGLDDDAIGETLLLLPDTVHRTRNDIFEKIGVEGRTGATAYAYAAG